MSYESWPYLCVFAVLIAASFGVPIPEDIPLLTGGYLCYRGLAGIAIMIVVGMVGVLTGDFVLYSLGRKWGHHIVEHRFVRRLIRPARLVIAEKLFNQHGVKIIFAGRFLPGLRPMIFVASGVLKVPFWTFASVNGLAACISVPAMIFLGMFFGHNFEQLKTDVRTATQLIASGILIVALIAAGIYLQHRQKRMMASTGVDKSIDADTLTHMSPETKSPSEETEKPDAETNPKPAQITTEKEEAVKV